MVRSQGETEAGAVRRRARGAGSQGLGPRRACPRAELRLWPPQLHHACTGPGLSVLCVLRHDVLEHFSVYGTALSMWVSLMGECPPVAPGPARGVRMPHCPLPSRAGPLTAQPSAHL